MSINSVNLDDLVGHQSRLVSFKIINVVKGLDAREFKKLIGFRERNINLENY